MDYTYNDSTTERKRLDVVMFPCSSEICRSRHKSGSLTENVNREIIRTICHTCGASASKLVENCWFVSRHKAFNTEVAINAFKEKVYEKAMELKEKHGWCKEIDDALAELGVEPKETRLSITVVFDVASRGKHETVLADALTTLHAQNPNIFYDIMSPDDEEDED